MDAGNVGSMDAGVTRLERLRLARAERPALTSFLGVFSATLLCFLAIGAVLPVLPRYVKGPLGASDVAVGIVVGAFALTAFVGRPIGGRLADVRGRKWVHMVGLTICAVAGSMLFLPLGVAGLIFARLVIGFGDGWVFTAGVTWVVDLAPEDRRGQAIGIFGLAIWGGLTFGALIGEGAYALGGYDAVWAFATLAPMAGLLVARAIEPGPGVVDGSAHTDAEELEADALVGIRSERASPARARAARTRLRARLRSIGSFVPAPAVRPGLALALANVGYGTMAAFVVLLLDKRGIGSGATVFIVFAGTVVASRLLLGTLPDRIGPRRSAFGAGIAQACGLAMVGVAQSFPVALVGAAVMGTGMSLLFPSLALLVTRQVDDERRGAALGAFTAFFDLGVGLGAPFAGLVASMGGGEHYPAAFYAAAVCCLAGALLGYVSSRSVPEAHAL